MENREEIFESMPVPKAVASLAIPTILSQLVTMIYNLADTFFVGQTGDPLKVAAVSLAYPAFMVLTALGNLFGIGGGSLISRLLGAKQPLAAKKVSSFSFHACILTALAYSATVFIFMDPLLSLLGASDNTIGFGREYLFWIVAIGGAPTTLSLVIAHLLRSEGWAKQAGTGIALGGTLNIILDPIFIFPLGLGVAGAGIATMLSNIVVVIYYLLVLSRLNEDSVLSIHPRDIALEKRIVAPLLSVGFPACLATVLACVSNSVIFKLASGYGDIPVAAFGIVKKVDSIQMKMGLGLSQGILPLVAYNFSAKRFDRMKAVSRFARILGICLALLCVVIFELLADGIIGFFIKDNDTIATGALFLRIACLATPLMIANFLMNTTFQAMGKGRQSLIFTACRQGLINIPLLFLMRYLFGLKGLIWTQLLADSLTMIVALVMYRGILREYKI